MVVERESFFTANATGIINYGLESDLTQNNLYIQMLRNALYVKLQYHLTFSLYATF
jgi:hypothetical protein